MIRPVEPTTFLSEAARLPVVDVRSPGEFRQGHIPGAFNIPVFNDDERAEIGTLYVQSGRGDAILKGLDRALPHIGEYYESLEKIVASPGEILLHCWRGGLRSAMMAELFRNAGFHVSLLTGGYKAYRTYIREAFLTNAQVVVLGGYTGSGKTELLKEIEKQGEQVIDLEWLACHKGSAFGALGQPEQPTNEQFENNLYACWSKLDLSRRVWVEDESRTIGRITMPDAMVQYISNGMLIRVEMDPDMRISRLVHEYAGFDADLLALSIARIAERLGGKGTKDAIAALGERQFDLVAKIVLDYYDKAYQFSMDRRGYRNIHQIRISGTDMVSDASKVIAVANKNR